MVASKKKIEFAEQLLNMIKSNPDKYDIDFVWKNTGIVEVPDFKSGFTKIGMTGESELKINIHVNPNKSIQQVESELLNDD